jgi:hypothetical protein
MAIQLTTITPQGFTATDAYHRVENLSIQNKDSVSFLLCSYKDKADFSFKQLPLAAPYDLTGSNPFEQAYQFLKSLPEFSDAVDC